MTDDIGAPLTPEEYAALTSQLSLGARATLEKLPALTPAVIHLRVGGRAACTPFTSGVDPKGNEWREWQDDPAAELTSDVDLVTCLKCAEGKP